MTLPLPLLKKTLKEQSYCYNYFKKVLVLVVSNFALQTTTTFVKKGSMIFSVSRPKSSDFMKVLTLG